MVLKIALLLVSSVISVSAAEVVSDDASQPAFGKICSDFPQRISDHYGPEKVICTIRQSACGEDVTGVCKRIAEAGIQDCVSSYIPGDQESAIQAVYGCIKQYAETTGRDSLCKSMGSFEQLSPFDQEKKRQSCGVIAARAREKAEQAIGDNKTVDQTSRSFVTIKGERYDKMELITGLLTLLAIFVAYSGPIIFPIFCLIFLIRRHLLSVGIVIKMIFAEVIIVMSLITTAYFAGIMACVASVLLTALFIGEILKTSKKHNLGSSSEIHIHQEQKRSSSFYIYHGLTIITAPFIFAATWLIGRFTIFNLLLVLGPSVSDGDFERLLSTIGVFILLGIWILYRTFPQRIEKIIQKTFKRNH